jgi:NAD(P)-dependent dehydrogenase (short-subunit alcohol dehydrogenase family)
MKRFEGKSVIVTGGSRGIGRAICEAFGKEGAKVAVNYVRNKKAADEVCEAVKKAGSDAFPAQANVSVKTEVDAMIEETVKRFGGIDVLVNNAGICPFIDFLDFPEDEFDRIVDINFKGVFLPSQAAARKMKDSGGGAIVNVTSISGEMMTNPQQSVYCSSKAAANMLTRAMAAALGPMGIRVNAVLPGTVPTDINVDQLANAEVKDYIEEHSALGRLGKPEEIANAVLFLASEESAWTAGSRLVVDGGYML